MPMQTLKIWQGLQRDYQCLQINNNDGNAATDLYTSGTTLSASVWEGADQTTIFSPTVTWYTAGSTQTGYTQGQFSISFPAASTANLDPAGEYHVLVSTTTNGVTSGAWEGMLAVRATPGSTSPSPPDLTTYDYVLGFLRQNNLTDNQIDVIPLLIPAASQLWRLICGEQNFDQRTYTEWHEVDLSGYVRLWQCPVQIVTRVQGVPSLALTVINNSSLVQTAQAYFTYTTTTSGLSSIIDTPTGLYLDWVSSGVASNTTLLFANYPTITLLAAAINALGSGWTASVTGAFASWASTELAGGMVARAAAVESAYPTNGAIFQVLTDLPAPKLRPRTPLLHVGPMSAGNIDAALWGPGGQELVGYDDGNTSQGLVKVTYVAGFPTIPPEIQNQVAQLVKWKLELGVQELLLGMEKAADYEYTLEPGMVHAVPQTVREAAGWWKQHFA